MKIIISPSKTQDFTRVVNYDYTLASFPEKTLKIVKKIQELSINELASVMKIKGKILDKTFNDYKKFDELQTNHAITSYNGSVFKGIEIEKYNIEDMNYLNDHLIILSALYGLLRPFDVIKPYRLDMKMKIKDINLYNYWSEEVNNHLKNEELIINLASEEFAKLVNLPMKNICFKENRNGIFKTIGTYSKKARGLMVNYIIKNKINTIEEISKFNIDGYILNEDLSNENNLVFTR